MQSHSTINLHHRNHQDEDLDDEDDQLSPQCHGVSAGNAHHHQMMLDPNPNINELRRLIPTIGMDRSRSKSSPMGVAGGGSSSTSNSEKSLRSPSGLSSLPSLGSPSPLGFDTATPQDWYVRSGSGSAFRPLGTGPHLSGSGNGLLIRPKVGTDPRDAKNPLSVSQLTGGSGSGSTRNQPTPDAGFIDPDSGFKMSANPSITAM